MMPSWRLGTILGFPVELNWSFGLLLLLVFLAFGGIAGVVLVCLAFGSVLLHELGHALVARRLGVRVSGIELSFFGGAAKMTELPRTANHELAIAAAGPAVSLALGGAALGLAALVPLTPISALLAWLGWTNLVIAGFNLIPALPMDGGRILRALLTRKLDFVRATDVAVMVSRGAAIAFAVIGLAGAYQLLVLAPFLWLLASREQMLARMMADQYATRSYGGVEVLGRDAWERRGAPMRRYTIRQRDGRLVIEEL